MTCAQSLVARVQAQVKNFKLFFPWACTRAKSLASDAANMIIYLSGISYFADLRMTFRQNFFLQDWFRNKLGVGLG
jgi:hypothetical protein